MDDRSYGPSTTACRQQPTLCSTDPHFWRPRAGHNTNMCFFLQQARTITSSTTSARRHVSNNLLQHMDTCKPTRIRRTPGEATAISNGKPWPVIGRVSLPTLAKRTSPQLLGAYTPICSHSKNRPAHWLVSPWQGIAGCAMSTPNYWPDYPVVAISPGTPTRRSHHALTSKVGRARAAEPSAPIFLAIPNALAHVFVFVSAAVLPPRSNFHPISMHLTCRTSGILLA